MYIGMSQVRRCACAANRPSKEEIGHRAVGNRNIVEDRPIQAKRDHVAIYAIGAGFNLIEDAVAATQNGLLAERSPGEAQARSPLILIRVSDDIRQPGLVAGLDVSLEQ